MIEAAVSSVGGSSGPSGRQQEEVVAVPPSIGSNYGRFTDRNPDMTSAGKLITMEGETTQLCLNIERVQTPDQVKKFRNFTQAEPQVRRVFYGKALDPDIASTLCHGIKTNPSLFADELINPEPKSLFVKRTTDKKESSHYLSKQKGPLGKSHDQTAAFPKDIDKDKVTFGIKNVFDVTAGELVSPSKSHGQVLEEGEVGRDLYKVTHHEFHVGEAVDRNYDWSRYPKESSVFGIATPHDNDGKKVKSTLQWLRNDQLNKGTKIVSKRVDEFRERTQPQLGLVHDPIKETMRVPSDHTFGILIKPDEFGAGDLIHARSEGTYLRGQDRDRGLLAAVRQQLKKANYHNFNDLKAAFNHYDKNKDGKIDIHELRSCCNQFSLPIDSELLEQLIAYCDNNKDGHIDYAEFANFLNWKDKMQQGREPKEEAAAARGPEDTERLKKQIDHAVGEHRTSSSMISAVVGGASTKDYRMYGIPTIRSDLAAPRIKRISDTKNYGDESDAFGLINPSLFNNRGIYEKDFFKARPQSQIQDIFTSVGVQMNNETFQKLWDIASSRSDRGEVSVESFRSVLDEVQTSQCLVETS